MKRQLQSGAIPPDPEKSGLRKGRELLSSRRRCTPLVQDLRWEAFGGMAANFPGDAMDDRAAAERRAGRTMSTTEQAMARRLSWARIIH